LGVLLTPGEDAVQKASAFLLPGLHYTFEVAVSDGAHRLVRTRLGKRILFLARISHQKLSVEASSA
jgi:hypothetical protein